VTRPSAHDLACETIGASVVHALHEVGIAVVYEDELAELRAALVRVNREADYRIEAGLRVLAESERNDARARVSELEDHIRLQCAEADIYSSYGRNTEAGQIADEIRSRRGEDWRATVEDSTPPAAEGAQDPKDQAGLRNAGFLPPDTQPVAAEVTCQWVDDRTADELMPGESFEPPCTEPATHTTCDPIGGVVCARHRCRCSRPLCARCGKPHRTGSPSTIACISKLPDGR
jgi:hypothetical protein